MKTSDVVILAHHSSITFTQKKLVFIPALSALCMTVQATLTQTYWELVLVCQQPSHMTFVKSSLFPVTTLLFKGSHAFSELELLAAWWFFVCEVRSLQRRQICSPSSGISAWEDHGEEQGLCCPGHISVGLWMQLQEVCGTSNLLLPIRSYSELDNSWLFITVSVICPELTILSFTTILL